MKGTKRVLVTGATGCVGRHVLPKLVERGHEVMVWPDFVWRAGAVCVQRAERSGVIAAGADPRRPSYAVGW